MEYQQNIEISGAIIVYDDIWYAYTFRTTLFNNKSNPTLTFDIDAEEKKNLVAMSIMKHPTSANLTNLIKKLVSFSFIDNGKI